MHVSPIESSLEAEAVEGCQAQLHLLPKGGFGVSGQRSKKGLMRVREDESLLI